MRTTGLLMCGPSDGPLPLNPYPKPAMKPTDLLAHLQARLSGEMTQTAQQKFYGRAIVLVSLLNCSEPTADLKQRLVSLLARYGTVPLTQMGVPHDWRNRPLWL